MKQKKTLQEEMDDLQDAVGQLGKAFVKEAAQVVLPAVKAFTKALNRKDKKDKDDTD